MNGEVQYYSGVTALGAKDLRDREENREHLLFQNQDASADMIITLDGSTPTATNGLLILPRGHVEYNHLDWVPLGPVKVYCASASKRYHFEIGG